MAISRRRKMMHVSFVIHEFLKTIEKGKIDKKTGERSMICKHTGKHVVTEKEYKEIILEKYKIDMDFK